MYFPVLESICGLLWSLCLLAGLPNYSPGSADRNLVRQAVSQSERDVVEKTMLEDKIRATGKNLQLILI